MVVYQSSRATSYRRDDSRNYTPIAVWVKPSVIPGGLDDNLEDNPKDKARRTIGQDTSHPIPPP